MDINGKYGKRKRRESLIRAGCDLDRRPWPPQEIKICLNLYFAVTGHRENYKEMYNEHCIGKIINRAPSAIQALITRLTLNINDQTRVFVASIVGEDKLCRDKAWWTKREIRILKRWVIGRQKRIERSHRKEYSFPHPLPVDLAFIFGRSVGAVEKRLEWIRQGIDFPEYRKRKQGFGF